MYKFIYPSHVSRTDLASVMFQAVRFQEPGRNWLRKERVPNQEEKFSLESEGPSQNQARVKLPKQ